VNGYDRHYQRPDFNRTREKESGIKGPQFFKIGDWKQRRYSRLEKVVELLLRVHNKYYALSIGYAMDFVLHYYS
jgi:hypothetical protein